MKVALLTDSLYKNGSDYVPGGQSIVEGLRKEFLRNKVASNVRVFITRTKQEIVGFNPDLIFSLSPIIGVECDAFKITMLHDIYPNIDYKDCDADVLVTNSSQLLARLSYYRPVYFINFGVDTEVFKPVAPDPKYAHDFVFLGNGQWKSQQTMRHFLSPFDGEDLALYGYGWEHPCAKGILPVGEEAKLYSSAKVVINFTKDEQKHLGMMNTRVLETLACGAILLTDVVPMVRLLFADICFCEDVWDKEILNMCLKASSDALLKEKIRERIIKCHTWERFVEKLITIMKAEKK